MKYTAFCDGSCIKIHNTDSTGNGGYASIMGSENTSPDTWSRCVDGDRNVTSNQMEMCALIATIQLAISNNVKDLVVHTDSQYVCSGITSWVKTWERNNWRTAQNKPVKNVELWKELLALIRKAKFDFFAVLKVSGHSGIEGNEIVDKLANDFARSL